MLMLGCVLMLAHRASYHAHTSVLYAVLWRATVTALFTPMPLTTLQYNDIVLPIYYFAFLLASRVLHTRELTIPWVTIHYRSLPLQLCKGQD